jgi:hypothetical protein
MNPPTEQLVRDYLNRLSVAARGRLGSKERQILLDRTRMRIEAECGGAGAASAVRVRQVLAGLGDPISLVDAEHATVVAVAAPAVVAAAGGPFLEAPVSREDPPPDKTPDPGAGPGRGGSASDGAGPSPVVPLVPRPASSPDPLRKPAPSPASAPASAPAGDDVDPKAAEIHVELVPETEVETGQNRVAEGLDAAISFISRATVGMAAAANRHKVEALAVVLLGVGGGLFPPVWLIGAVLVITSKKVWDFRDKWLAIGLPVLVVIVGTAVILVVGGQRQTLGSYVTEVWIGAGRLCRLTAVLGAGYLLWRLRHGRRRPRQPPWNVPRKLDL